MSELRTPVTNRLPLIVGSLLIVGFLVAAIVAGMGVSAADPSNASEPPIEEEYVEPVPEEDDPYFEAEANDGSWISYINPRDEYRNPYLGDGSGKICVTLLNEDGEPIVGETVPNTTVTVPTGDSLAWHSSADPITVRYPLTDHYDRPLDADQFGTTPDLPQGDGYLDSHCVEFHGLDEEDTIAYGEAEIEGEYADRIELVGYIQQAHDSWDTDVDPIEDAESYEEAGGEWTYRPDASHGQAVVVLQLDPPEDAYADDEDEDADEDEQDVNDETDDGSSTDESGTGADDDDSDDEEPGETEVEGGSDDDPDEMPGLGVLAALVALTLVALERTRR